MSTITSEFTNEQLIAKAREQIAFCRNTKITGEGRTHVNQCSALFEIALASLEADPVYFVEIEDGQDINAGRIEGKNRPDLSLLPDGINHLYAAPPAPANAEPVAWLWSNRKHPGEVTLVRPEDDEKAEGAHWSGWSCQALYAEPPAPVSVPDEVSWEDVPEEITEDDMALASAWAHGFNQCRAAILQGAERVSNRDELPLDYLQGQKDGLEWAAQLAEANHPQTGDWLYDDPLELAKAIRKGPDMPKTDGNSPVIPDGWVACSERMPERGVDVLACTISPIGGFEEIEAAQWHGGMKGEQPVFITSADAIEPTHWMPLPNPPQE
ncbi:DUF551 domain-containing protein [Enterobacter kobei]